MEKYKKAKEFPDFRRRKPPPLPVEDDGRRIHHTPNKKMRVEREKECVINNATNNDSGCTTNSNSTTGSSSFQGSGRRSRSPRPGFDPATPSGQKPQSPLSFSRGVGPGPSPGRGSKLVNWRLACFMAREYLSRGTLLGKPWPPRDSNLVKSKTTTTTAAEQDETPESRRDKERLYSILTDDFLRSDDIHIPGIVNPTQLASWMGFK